MSNFMVTNDIFDDFEELFPLGFMKKPLYSRFETPNTKDLHPVADWKKDGDNYSTVIRMVGIDPDDVKVELEDRCISISGESETFGEKYSQTIKLGIAKETMANIKSVKYNVQNGMCKILLEMEEPRHKHIDITKE